VRLLPELARTDDEAVVTPTCNVVPVIPVMLCTNLLAVLTLRGDAQVD
jgi:hypothetical protein